MLRNQVLVLSCLHLLGRISGTSATCYFADGDETGNDEEYKYWEPCDPDADNSMCCRNGDTCLANRMCITASEVVYRGACTDRTWKTFECVADCNELTYAPLRSCGNLTNDATSCCCFGDDNCCRTGGERLEILPVDPDTWATWDVSQSTFQVVGTTVERDRTTNTQYSRPARNSRIKSTPAVSETTMNTEATFYKDMSSEGGVDITRIVIWLGGTVAGLALAISAGIWLVRKRRKIIRDGLPPELGTQPTGPGAIMRGAIAPVELEAPVNNTTERAELPAT